MAEALSWLGCGLDDSVYRHPVNVQFVCRLLISFSGMGAANARAEKKSEEGKEKGDETHFCGTIVCVVEAGAAKGE